VQNNLGVALAREQKFVEALTALQQAVAVDTQQPDYWFNLGLLQIRAGRADAAVDPLRRVLALRPNDAEARTLMATALEQSGHGDEADKERGTLSQASARVVVPRNPAPADLARFDRIRMRLDPAALRQHAQPSSSGAADNASGRQDLALHLSRGRQFLDSGNLDDAQRAFIEALLLAPLDADAHNSLAQVYDLQGRPNDGVREYRAALVSRDDLMTHVALAGLLLRQDRIAEARVEVQLVLNRDPNNARARTLLDQINNRSTAVGPP
jgi:Flp pilus assembly protein TadD